MIRSIWFIGLLAAIVAVALWFADRPGAVILEWQGWRVDTSVAVLAALVALVSTLVAALYRAWLALRSAPRRLARARRDSRRRRGYLALTRGMVAVAAGDASEARKQVKRAEVLLGDPPLTMLLSAQASQLNGDEGAAERFFAAMLVRPETEFLGVRGLLTQAMKRDQSGKALELAQRAHGLRPESAWVTEILCRLQVRQGQWSAARRTLEKCVKAGIVTAAAGRHQAAVLDTELGREARRKGDAKEALRLSRKAVEQEPGFAPAVVDLASLLLEIEKPGRAEAVIDEAWAAAPHPDMLEPWFAARRAGDALARAQEAQRLARRNPDHAESHMALAGTALEARLWGEARKHLKAAGGDAPNARVCRMMAEVEEAEHGDTAAARDWLMKATSADPAPSWVCGECGATAAAWSALCGNCDAFATLSWRTPPHVSVLVGPAAAAEALPAPEVATGAP